MRRPAGRSACTEAQAGCDPRLSNLATQATERLARPTSASIAGSLTRRHRSEGWQGALYPPLTGSFAVLAGIRYGHGNKRRSRDGIRTSECPLAARWYAGRNTGRLRGGTDPC
jgi:hypothetical protein